MFRPKSQQQKQIIDEEQQSVTVELPSDSVNEDAQNFQDAQERFATNPPALTQVKKAFKRPKINEAKAKKWAEQNKQRLRECHSKSKEEESKSRQEEKDVDLRCRENQNGWQYPESSVYIWNFDQLSREDASIFWKIYFMEECTPEELNRAYEVFERYKHSLMNRHLTIRDRLDYGMLKLWCNTVDMQSNWMHDQNMDTNVLCKVMRAYNAIKRILDQVGPKYEDLDTDEGGNALLETAPFDEMEINMEYIITKYGDWVDSTSKGVYKQLLEHLAKQSLVYPRNYKLQPPAEEIVLVKSKNELYEIEKKALRRQLMVTGKHDMGVPFSNAAILARSVQFADFDSEQQIRDLDGEDRPDMMLTLELRWNKSKQRYEYKSKDSIEDFGHSESLQPHLGDLVFKIFQSIAIGEFRERKITQQRILAQQEAMSDQEGEQQSDDQIHVVE